ncbi:MAG: hypothetical protein ACYDDI_03055 [Candidatus Acidiferrales bacterium]
MRRREAMILWCLGTRLWQRAAETLWYQHNFVPAAPPATYTPATYPVVSQPGVIAVKIRPI